RQKAADYEGTGEENPKVAESVERKVVQQTQKTAGTQPSQRRTCHNEIYQRQDSLKRSAVRLIDEGATLPQGWVQARRRTLGRIQLNNTAENIVYGTYTVSGFDQAHPIASIAQGNYAIHIFLNQFILLSGDHRSSINCAMDEHGEEP